MSPSNVTVEFANQRAILQPVQGPVLFIASSTDLALNGPANEYLLT